MLKVTLNVLMLCIGWVSYAQIKLPDLSPAVEISQKIGLTTATLSYSRPSLRGRDLFGEDGVLIVGEKWRTGANATTKFEISGDIEIGGQELPKGSYALLTTPSESIWTFHFYAYEKLFHTAFLERKPVLEITVPSQYIDYYLETFSLHFESMDLNSATLVLQWGNYKVEVPVKIDEHKAIMANIEMVLQGPSDFNYFQAALYLHETQTDLPLALSYIQKVTQSESALFFQVYREALILKDLNRNDEAIEVARRAKELALKSGNADVVRLSQKIVDELVR